MGLIDYKSVSVTSKISAFDKDSSNYITQFCLIQGDSQMSDNSGGGCKNYLTLFIDRIPGSDENFKSSAGVTKLRETMVKLVFKMVA